MFRFLTTLFGNSPGRARPARRVRLELESLEERSLPTAGITQAGYEVHIQATDKGDKVVVTRNDNGTPNNPFDDSVNIQWTRGDTGQTTNKDFNLYVYQLIGDKLHRVDNVNKIVFYGGAGADKVWNNTDLPSKLLGMSGNDELHGGSVHDEIQGGLGSDKIYGGDGYDYLWANGPSQGGSDPSAIDYVYGEKGPDDMYGGYKQFDFLFGGDGIDHLNGADAGTNYLYGGDGTDVLRGGGNGAINFLYGGAGDDWMIGGSAKFGQPKVFNQMIDDEGKDTFVGGNRAFNWMNAVDGGFPGQEDVVVPGVINANNLISVDANDTIWDFANGPYPVSPP